MLAERIFTNAAVFQATGLGIPSGGGVIVHADTTIEALHRHSHEIRFEATRVTHSMLCAEEGN